MKTYIGIAHEGAGACQVMVQAGDVKTPLDPRHDLRNHSPDGFQWGYGGSGPAQLAIALVADAIGDDEVASAVYQDFKFAFVGKWPMGKAWTISQLEIATWVANWGNGRYSQRLDS